MPKVSIIVPTYNVEKYARRCFESLLSQTLQDIEIILVDDGSTDSSGRICDEYAQKDSRIRVIHQSNRGLGLSRNSGLQVAEGEYIGFVDSDDCISPDMFRILYENARDYEADISYCLPRKFSEDRELEQLEPEKEQTVRIWTGAAEIRQYMLDRIGMPPEAKQDNLYGASVWCGIFSHKLIRQLNAAFVSERQFIAEDIIFDIDVIPHCRKIVHSSLHLYYYRYNPASLTTVYKGDRYEKNVVLYHEMIRRLKQYYSDEELFACMSRYLITAARIAVIQEIRFAPKNGNKTARSHILQICRNPELTEVLKNYPYQKMPLKYAVTCMLQKYRRVNLLMLLTRLSTRRK